MPESTTAISIFNEVMGPVMRGCSSSHVAAALRIGRMARNLVHDKPKSATVTFDSNEALCQSYDGQGSAMGFVGGLLGYEPDSPLLPAAREDAPKLGVQVDFRVEDIPTNHPNTYLIDLQGQHGEPIFMEAVSLGGGAIEIRNIAGAAVAMRGDAYVTLMLQKNAISRADLESILPDYQSLSVSEGDQGTLNIIQTLSPLKEEQKAALQQRASGQCFFIAPVMPVLANTDAVPFNTAQAMLAQDGAAEKSLFSLACQYESARSGCSTDELVSMMRDIGRVMKTGISTGTAGTTYPDRILPAQSPLAKNLQGNPLLGGGMQRTIAYVAALMDCKSAMEVIVAAPTAGACGTLGGAVWAAADELGKSEDDVAEALLTAGIVGVFIAEQATFAGEEGGCQVECGSGGAMAAAALVHMMGGNAQQAVDAASMALQNTLGLVCDTVGDRVEVPCMGRNIMAAVNAMACAGMALAGFNKVIPLDEAITAMKEVVGFIPLELRCTGLAGLAVTPTGKQIFNSLHQKQSA